MFAAYPIHKAGNLSCTASHSARRRNPDCPHVAVVRSNPSAELTTVACIMGRHAGARMATLVCAVALCVLMPLSHGLPYEIEHDGKERQMWCKCSTFK